ncbi:MAG: Ribose-phosphate pyrophosphokinase [Chloroflexi bacterium ADurb.Bin325]|nr:MAG: Ribose-phosphate pyrophosphokinase [Chloroflexi bacterium ADurb.Bin325]
MHGHSTLVKMYGDMMVFSGTANRRLAEEVAACLHEPLGEADIQRFPNSNTFVRLHQSVRAKDVFLIQPTSAPVNDRLMELLIFIDTLRRDSAGRITAVVPYYGYGRTDKKDQPRVPITARLVADLIDVAGADRLLTLDLHAKQIQGFFSIPCDELPALDLFVDYFKRTSLTNTVVLSPDIGALRRARNFAERLDLPLAVIEKRRTADGGRTEIFNLIGDVRGKNVILVDDEIDTAGTLTKAADFARAEGALDVVACATHAIFSEPAPDRIRESVLSAVVVTDTVALTPEQRRRCGDKIRVIPVAPLLAEVIRRIHTGRSVGELFDE